VVGIGAALMLARRKFFGSRALTLAFDIPVAVSPIIIGVALVLAYSRIGWFGSWLASHGITNPVLTDRHRDGDDGRVPAPTCWRSVLPVLIEVGKDQEDAARTLGAGAFRTFWQVTLPAIRWGRPLRRNPHDRGAPSASLARSWSSRATSPARPRRCRCYIFDAWDQKLRHDRFFRGRPRTRRRSPSWLL